MRLTALLTLAAALFAGSALAQGAGAPPAQAGVYADEAAWLCRPGRRDACATKLDAVRLWPDGRRTLEPFTPAAAPPIDCFYVYPTVSSDPGMLSDRVAGPEEANMAWRQVARFTSQCRVFAPVYRQVTSAGIFMAVLMGRSPDWTPAYQDVRAAWRDYLRRDNGGRGVVLIGHSQGAIVLGQLLAEEIERDPAQSRLLVSAVLAGHPGVPDPGPQSSTAGAQRVTPLCRTRGQIGCAVVFATYAAEDQSPRFFGAALGPDRPAACVHPGAPGGGAGPLQGYLRNPGAGPNDPPFLRVEGQLQAECVSDAAGSVLRVRVPPGPNAALLQDAMVRSSLLPTWGLHILDLELAQGSLLEMVEAQSRAWTARTGTTTR